MLLIECVRLGVCDVHGISVTGGMHKYMHSHVFTCLLIHLWPRLKLEMDSWTCVCVCPCALPVQNAERGAPSCEAEAACQCCPSGTDTRGASGLLNRLPG